MIKIRDRVFIGKGKGKGNLLPPAKAPELKLNSSISSANSPALRANPHLPLSRSTLPLNHPASIQTHDINISDQVGEPRRNKKKPRGRGLEGKIQPPPANSNSNSNSSIARSKGKKWGTGGWPRDSQFTLEKWKKLLAQHNVEAGKESGEIALDLQQRKLQEGIQEFRSMFLVQSVEKEVKLK